MRFIKVRTRALVPPQDNIYPILDTYLPKLKEGDVVFITSKILSIHQGRCLLVSNAHRRTLIKKEADMSLPPAMVGNSEIIITIKNNTLIPSAGIDRSNANGYSILWPKNVNKLLEEIYHYLTKKNQIKKLAIVATDSHTTPLRWGTSGISIGLYGMEPLYDYRGEKDIFGRALEYTQSNITDSLSAMAVLLMGEGREQTPIIIGRAITSIAFTNKPTYHKLIIPPKKDLYYPLLKNFKK